MKKNKIICRALLGSLLLNSCAPSGGGFEAAYSKLVSKENAIGLQLSKFGPKPSFIQRVNFDAVVTQECYDENKNLGISYRKYLQGLESSADRKRVVTSRVFELVRKHGAVSPRKFKFYGPQGEIFYSVPWDDYLPKEEYMDFVESQQIKKSNLAERTWKF